jgi:plasmid maintenance system antidote protein VapI
MSKKKTVSEVLRKTIKNSGLSLYAVAKGSGVGYAMVHRFVTGERGLSQTTIDTLCEHFGLELRKRK